eukprot:CAMPEP_0194435496 /NCGR_PEP_ID=MMETSP0176-20130528/89017_1 /TAXON_ID=216777 /ORGANISM="Proboscia alata, Strain PI-D3" /LENGTH=61 /DNA_ID=CAMNT_0039254833 /DNA_START=111 /DNA_END=292 /DNA_ORIENTATION=-
MIERSNKETLRSIAMTSSHSNTASRPREDRTCNRRMSSRSYLEEDWVDEYCKQPIVELRIV